MASEKEASCHNCANDPNFAIICSFFDRFSETCGIPQPTFFELQEMLECSQDVPSELIDLHIKLLRKIRKSIASGKWERALIKFCHSYRCSEDGWELERCGYKKCKVSVRLSILKNLLDAQFDLNSKFKTDINKLTAEELRLEPLGRDKVGQSYWCQFDSGANVRVYKEDQDEETWKMVAKDREDLVGLITQLSSGEELLGLELINEDSNSQEGEKPIIDTGQVLGSTSEENTADNINSMEMKIENCNRVKEDSSSSLTSQNNLAVDIKVYSSKTSDEQCSEAKNTVNAEEAGEIIKTSGCAKTIGESVARDKQETANNLNVLSPVSGVKEIVESSNLLDNVKKDSSTVNIMPTCDIKGNVPCENSLNDNTSNDNNKLPLKSVTNDVISTSKNLQTKKESKDSNHDCESDKLCEKESKDPDDGINSLSEDPNYTKSKLTINVAEEIKQRSLSKSINLPSSKTKMFGSKLDQIFSRKLEKTNHNSNQDLKSDTTVPLESPNKGNNDLQLSDKADDTNCSSSILSREKTDGVHNNNSHKRKPDNAIEHPIKKMCIMPESEVGEEIEEPVMIIRGEGTGNDCDTGNPEREKNENAATSAASGDLSKTEGSSNSNPVLGSSSKLESEKLRPNNECIDNGIVDKNIEQKELSQGSKDLQVCSVETCENAKIMSTNTNASLDHHLPDAINTLDSDSENVKLCIQLNKSPTKNDLNTSQNNKSIEEQLSDLTGESPELVEGTLDQSGDGFECLSKVEKPGRKKSLTSDIDDNDTVPPVPKKTKVINNEIDIFGCDEDNSNSVSDNIKSMLKEKNEINCLNFEKDDDEINSKKEDCQVEVNLKESNDMKIIKQTVNDFPENSSAHCNNKTPKVTTKEENVDYSSENCEEAKSEKPPKISTEKTTTNDDKINDTEDQYDKNTYHTSGSLKDGNFDLKSAKLKSEENTPEKSEVTNPGQTNKKHPTKKSPKPRRKIFTTKSRKKSKQNNEISKKSINLDLSVDGVNKDLKNHELNLEKDAYNLLSNKREEEPKIKSKPPGSISNRKRRNSKKHTIGTEKDSDEEACSDKKDNEEDEEVEVGGKRRKFKGKRVPNKTLRKSIEEKRKSKSSSEEGHSSEEQQSKKPTKENLFKKEPLKKAEQTTSQTQLDDTEDSNRSEKQLKTGKIQKKPKAQGRNSRAYCGIDMNNININETSRSVRQSSRLAQIKIKEQADNKHEELNIHDIEKSGKKTKKKKDEDEEKKRTPKKKGHRAKKFESEEDEAPEEDSQAEKKRRRKKKKKHPLRSFNERDPWKSSSGSSSDAEDEEEDHFEDIVDEEDFVPIRIKSDHEFSPESDLESEDDIKPVRRARTAQKDSTAEDDGGDLDDFACEKCGKKDHPEWILLCDTCDLGWHASCLRPSLMLVPEGDWHCPPCQHTKLVQRLEESLNQYDKDSKRRENEELRRKRLAYVGISLDNVLPKDASASSASGSDSGSDFGSGSDSSEPVYQLRQRRQGPTSYRFNDYDELINSAIQDEVEAAGKVIGEPIAQNSNEVEQRGEETSNKSAAPTKRSEIKNEVAPDVAEETISRENKAKDDSNEESSDDENEQENEEEEEEEFPSVVPKRNNILPRPGKKKHRKLNSLDDPSDDDDGSDEDFKGSSSEEEEDEEEDDSYDTDTGRRRPKRNLVPVRRSSRTRRSRIDKEFINDDSEESDAPRRKKTKKLWSESDSESDDSTWGRRKKKKNHGTSGRRKNQRNKKFCIEDELSETETSKVPKKKRQRKVKYGGLDELPDEEDLPSRRTRGKKINYVEVVGTDSEEEIQKPKSFKRSVIEDDEDEFVAEKDKEDSETSSTGGEEESEDEDKSGDNKQGKDKVKEKVREVLVKKKEEKDKVEKNYEPEIHVPQPHPVLQLPHKLTTPAVCPPKAPSRRGRPPKAMIAPPPERLISEDEQYKAIVSKVSTAIHNNATNDNKPIVNEKFNSSFNIKDPQTLHKTPVKNMNSSSEPERLLIRSPPIKIRSGVPVIGGTKSPGLASSTDDVNFFPAKSQILPEKVQFQVQRTLVPIPPGGPPFFNARKSINPPRHNVKSEHLDENVEELDDDLSDDIEEEEDDDEFSEEEVLEDGEIPKKVARRMARMEERLQKQEGRRSASQAKDVKPVVTSGQEMSPGTGPSAGATDQKPAQPMLRVVSPLKLMANPPGPMQSAYPDYMGPGPRPPMGVAGGPTARMPMQMRPPHPQPPPQPQPQPNMMPMMPVDEGSPGKRRGRGRGKKTDKPDEMMAGGGMIRGMLQQPQSYPPTHYPQQYPPHNRIPFNPQRMPRPQFHPGHHPMDPSPSGGGPISVKQEQHPQSAPVHIPSKPTSTSTPSYHHPPPAPLTHRFDQGMPRPNYPPPQTNPPGPKPQYGSYPPPPGPGTNYHYGSYPPPPIPPREEPPQVYPVPVPVQQSYNEQFNDQPPPQVAPPSAPVSSNKEADEESSEFGGLVSYFSSQREDDLET